jgi:hypothetical protein
VAPRADKNSERRQTQEKHVFTASGLIKVRRTGAWSDKMS